jgi:hypothetical protein
MVNGNSQTVDVPVVVKEKVLSLYPQVTQIEWEVERNNYEAEFTFKGQEVEMLLDKNGHVLESEIDLALKELPAVIVEKLSVGNEKFRVTKITRIEQQSGIRYMVVKLSENSRERLLFDNSGILISRKVLEKSKSNDGRVEANRIAPGLSSYGKKWELPVILREVSGIVLINEREVACVQDELGVIFIYDLVINKIIKEIDFSIPGDFEGITVVGNTAYVLRSDGVLFEVENYMGQPSVTEHQVLTGASLNLEGLCYDFKSNSLLIVPREFETSDFTKKGVYAFDLSSRKMSKEPIMHIDLNDPKLLPYASRKSKEAFIPSEIAVNPVSGNIYVSDARNGLIMIKNSKGETLKVEPLNKRVFQKTEGIAFSTSGDMYLSNEGKKSAPNIIGLKSSF